MKLLGRVLSWKSKNLFKVTEVVLNDQQKFMGITLV